MDINTGANVTGQQVAPPEDLLKAWREIRTALEVGQKNGAYTIEEATMIFDSVVVMQTWLRPIAQNAGGAPHPALVNKEPTPPPMPGAPEQAQAPEQKPHTHTDEEVLELAKKAKDLANRAVEQNRAEAAQQQPQTQESAA